MYSTTDFNSSRKTNESGFTLLELLVTIVIGIFISLAATSFLTKTARSYNHQDMTARIQENARFAIQAMSYDTRQAGFFGCSLISPDGFAAIEGENNTPAGEPDKLTIRYARADLGAYDVNNPKDAAAGSSLPPTANSTSLSLYKAGSGETADDIGLIFEPGDEILVSDCFKSEIATVKTVANNVLTLENGLQNNYLAVTQVYFASDFTYEIQPATDTAPSVLIRTTTLKATADPIVEPLVQGIDYMRVLYGVNQSSSNSTVPDEYIAWDPKLLNTDIWRIVSIKVGLMARSVSNDRNSQDGQYGLTKFPGKYAETELLDLKFEDLNLAEDDRVSRRTFVNTLQVRNQL